MRFDDDISPLTPLLPPLMSYFLLDMPRRYADMPRYATPLRLRCPTRQPFLPRLRASRCFIRRRRQIAMMPPYAAYIVSQSADYLLSHAVTAFRRH